MALKDQARAKRDRAGPGPPIAPPHRTNRTTALHVRFSAPTWNRTQLHVRLPPSASYRNHASINFVHIMVVLWKGLRSTFPIMGRTIPPIQRDMMGLLPRSHPIVVAFVITETSKAHLPDQVPFMQETCISNCNHHQKLTDDSLHVSEEWFPSMKPRCAS